MLCSLLLPSLPASPSPIPGQAAPRLPLGPGRWLGFAGGHLAPPPPARVWWPRRNPALNPHGVRPSPQTAAFVYWSKAWPGPPELTRVMFHMTHLSRAQPPRPLFSSGFFLAFLFSFLAPFLSAPDCYKKRASLPLGWPGRGPGRRQRERARGPREAAVGDLGGTAEKPGGWGRAFPKDSTEPTDCVLILITCHFHPRPPKLCPGEERTCEARSPVAQEN